MTAASNPQIALQPDGKPEGMGWKAWNASRRKASLEPAKPKKPAKKIFASHMKVNSHDDGSRTFVNDRGHRCYPIPFIKSLLMRDAAGNLFNPIFSK